MADFDRFMEKFIGIEDKLTYIVKSEEKSTCSCDEPKIGCWKIQGKEPWFTTNFGCDKAQQFYKMFALEQLKKDTFFEMGINIPYQKHPFVLRDINIVLQIETIEAKCKALLKKIGKKTDIKAGFLKNHLAKVHRRLYTKASQCTKGCQKVNIVEASMRDYARAQVAAEDGLLSGYSLI